MNNIITRFWQPVGGIFLFFVIFWGYFQAEILTNFHAQEFVSFCRDQEISQVKVLEFNKIKGEAKIYCIYSNNDLNSKLSLNYYDQNWKVITKKTLNVEGEIYWPVYLMQ